MSTMLAIVTSSAVAGGVGSAHCVGMCGGLSGLFAAQSEVSAVKRSWQGALAYNAGRLLSYALLGAGLATIGGGVTTFAPALTGPLRILAGVLVVLIGLQIAFGLRLLGPLDRAGAALWSFVRPVVSRLLPANTAPKAVALGALWGLLPCGLVYSMLAVALASGDALTGALAMTAFGAGTLPAMLLTGLSAHKLAKLLREKRVTAGVFVVAVGCLTLAMPLWHKLPTGDAAGHAHHHHQH